MLQVYDLRLDYRANPLGVKVDNPCFSWKIKTDQHPCLQKSYQIQVALDTDFRQIVWESGIVLSAQSQQVTYSGHPLLANQRYYFRVRLEDNHQQRTDWSKLGYFHTALDSRAYKGAFITAPQAKNDDSSAAYLFRRNFDLRSKLRYATLFLTAKGIFKASISGQEVGHDCLAPGWTEYKKRLLYYSYDVTELLCPGENALGVMVGIGWYRGDLASWVGNRNFYGSQSALWLELHLEYENGDKEVIASDSTWQTAPSPITFSEIYHGEAYDARLEQRGWDCPGFDAQSWLFALTESSDTQALYPTDGLPVGEHEIFPAQASLITPKGEQVIDFGQNLAGYVRFRVRGKAGDKVVLRHSEILDAAGNFYTDNLRRAQQKITYILKGDEEESFSPHFTYQGFRYICIDSFPGAFSLDQFEAVAIYSDMPETGTFQCSHPLLNRFIKNVEWGMKSNFVDIPTDCPQRDERLGWTGDAQIFARTASYLRETVVFFRKWLQDLAAAQLFSGSIPHVIPNVLQELAKKDPLEFNDNGGCGWGDAGVIIPWLLYKYYADSNILRNQYQSMAAWIQFIRNQATQGLIWEQGFQFGDWLALDAQEGSCYGATPNALTATAYYAYSVSLMAKIANVLDYKEDREMYQSLADQIKAAYQSEFFTTAGKLTAQTQTAHVLSLVFGLTPEQWRKQTAQGLVKLIQSNGGHVSTGFLGTPYLCYALSDNNYLEEAYALLLKTDYPSWLYQVQQGATTVWEHWDGLKPDGTMWSADMNSFNHYAYGAVADWLFSVVGGIDAVEAAPGYREILFAPRPGSGLSWAEAKLLTPYGSATCVWRKEKDHLQVTITIPANTTGQVILPTPPIDSPLPTKLPRQSPLSLGSGEYQFFCQLP